MPVSDEVIEKVVIDVLTALAEPSQPSIVFSNVHTRYREIDDNSIRNAVWRLIAKEKVELTPNRQLRIKHQNGAIHHSEYHPK